MKLGPVTKLDKKNMATSHIYMTVRLRRQDVIIIFLIYGQFEAIQKLDYGRMVCKTYIFITFFLTKTVIRTKKSNTALILLL